MTNNTSKGAKKFARLIALIMIGALLLAPGANAAAAKRLNLDDIVGRYLYANTRSAY